MLTTTAILNNDMLLEKYLTSPLEDYFHIKLKDEHPDYIKLKLCELLKYLSIAHHTFGNIPFNSELDEVWHFWILQTIQYQELMNQLPGKKFIHHCSNDYEHGKNEVDDETEIHRQFSFLVSYVHNFGGFTEESGKFWPMVHQLMNATNMNLIELNKYLSDSYDETSE